MAMKVTQFTKQPVYSGNEHHLNFDKIKDESYLAVPDQTVIVYKRAIISATNHLFVNRKYIQTGIKTFFDDRKLSFFKRIYLYHKSSFRLKEKYIGKYIWAHNDQSNNYYHWLCETLPRLFSIAIKNTDAVVILPEKFRPLKFMTEALDILKLAYVFFDDKHANFFDEIITIHTEPAKNIVNPVLQNQLTQALLKGLNIDTGAAPEKKVYLSRAKAKVRKIVNESEILPILIAAGYDIIYAEDLTFTQQVELFAAAKSFVSIHGAGHTNIMFMQPGTRVMEMRNGVWNQDPWKFNPLCYYQLANIFSINWVYLDTQPQTSAGNFNDIVIDLFAFKIKFNQFEHIGIA